MWDPWKEGRAVIKRETRREKRLARNCHLLPPPPTPHPFYPRASNAICTANGGRFARARRRTKTLLDPWSMGALGGAILGDVAATPKMAGLAYEVSCIMVFCWVPVVMVVGRRWRCVCVCMRVWLCMMGDGDRRTDEGKEEEFPVSSPVTHALSLFASIFCCC